LSSSEEKRGTTGLLTLRKEEGKEHLQREPNVFAVVDEHWRQGMQKKKRGGREEEPFPLTKEKGNQLSCFSTRRKEGK